MAPEETLTAESFKDVLEQMIKEGSVTTPARRSP